MPFITAGDPDLEATAALIGELAARGADLIEVGFPYSDPIADGPVIQASYTRALDRGIHVDDIFACIKQAAAAGNTPPLVAMVSFAIVFRCGTESFVQQACDAGFAGLIVPDLPADEASDLAAVVKESGLDLIQLIAPTTTKERTAKILATASGFLYCISIAGTTGVRDQLPAELDEQLRWLRTQSDIPLAVGFGISKPEQVDGLRGLADGIIVGSAIVGRVAAAVEAGTAVDEAIREVGQFVEGMTTAAHGAVQ